MHAVRSSTSLFAGVVALLLCAAGGCNDDDDAPTKCAPGPLATLTGRLLGPAGPLQGRIQPWLVIEGGPGQPGLYEHVFAGEDGRFSVCLAPGRYVLIVTPEGADATYYSADGCVGSSSQADTVTLTEQGLEVNFRWGGLRLDMSLPGHTDGDTIRATAELQDGSWLGRSEAVAEVRQERATLEFGGLPAGAYQVRFRFPDDQDRVYWYPHVLEEAEAETLLVEIDRQRRVENNWPGRVRFSSAVHGCWSRIDPNEVPEIAAVSDTGVYLLTTYTDCDGDFTLDFVLPEPFRIKIEVGHAGQQGWFGGADYVHAERFDLPAGTHTRDAYVVGGLVCIFEAPGPVVGEKIDLSLVDEGIGRAFSETRVVTAAGEVGIPLLPAGNYALRLQSVDACPGWLSQWFDRASEEAGAAVITIQGPEDVAEIVVRMVRAGAISGVIIHQGGAFLGSASVFACDAADSTRYAADGPADPVTGAFCLGGLDDGAYRLGLYRDGVGHSWFPGAARFADAEVLIIADGVAVTDLAWEVSP
jgi:hypothetical protein